MTASERLYDTCHSRESGIQGEHARWRSPSVPTFAGMTV